MNGSSDEMATLIADVRHDANNSLMTIFGYLEFLLEHRELPPALTARLKAVQAEAFKLRDCIARTASIRRPGT
jgi:signal transduction histidine kinase